MLPSFLQIQNLLNTYAARIDAGDFAGVGELFAHGRITVEENDVAVEGAAEVQQMYESWTRRYPDDGTPHTKHVTTNLVFDELDEETGSARTWTYVTVFQQTGEQTIEPILQGRYHDRFECVDGTWRFAHRHMYNDRLGDLSQHLLQDFG